MFTKGVFSLNQRIAIYMAPCWSHSGPLGPKSCKNVKFNKVSRASERLKKSKGSNMKEGSRGQGDCNQRKSRFAGRFAKMGQFSLEDLKQGEFYKNSLIVTKLRTFGELSLFLPGNSEIIPWREFKGQQNRGNRPRASEGNLPLRGSLRGRVFRGFQRFLEIFRAFQRFSEVFRDFPEVFRGPLRDLSEADFRLRDSPSCCP